MPRSAGAGAVKLTSALRPRAAAELAGVEHERRTRVETHVSHFLASGTTDHGSSNASGRRSGTRREEPSLKT